VKKNPRIFLIRPTEPNRGDLISRYGLLKRMAGRPAVPRCVVLSERDPAELPVPARVVRPGPLKDLIPRWRQIRLYRRGDEVWWACGHDLQDDSSALKLPFLLVKFLFFRLFGLRVRMIAQGAGPLETPFGRWCTARILALVDSASFRDPESLALVGGIAPRSAPRLRQTVDCALFAADRKAAPGGKPAGRPPLLGLNLRRWYHFDGHWLPFEYRTRLGLIRKIPGGEKMERFLTAMARFLDEQIEARDIRIRMIPMYPRNVEPWEDDVTLLKDLQNRMAHGVRAEVVEGDLSPERLLTVFGDLDAMIGVRLHSTIIATMLGVPSLHLAYSPKGHAYFRMIGQERFCLPLDRLSTPEGWEGLAASLDDLLQNRERIGARLRDRIEALTTHVDPLP
jgi:polysaccharide pyruvyl transferase WcaK-like protein